MTRSRSSYLIILPLIILSCQAPQEKKQPVTTKKSLPDTISVKLQMVTDAIEAPVELNVPPEDSLRRFITDYKGNVWILKNDSLLPKPFFRLDRKPKRPDKNSQIGSIFSLAFHPQYATNGKFYLSYAAPSSIRPKTGKLVISEFTAGKDHPDFTTPETEHRIFELEGKNVNNNGAEIAFGPDGYLYISIGDDGIGDSTYEYHAQDLNFFNGKILRIDVSKDPYGIPADNPFVASKNTKPEVWAYGFRKMWRFSFDPVTHELFGGDVGQEQTEEIDLVVKGANYGWPVKEGDSLFKKGDAAAYPAFTPPINTYTHKVGICVIGGGFYYGNKLPLLKNKYIFADFNGSMFALMKNKNGNWERQPLKIANKPTDPFFICSCTVDENNELFVMGFLNTKGGLKGAVYKIVQG